MNSSATTCQRGQRHSWWTHRRLRASENKGTPGELMRTKALPVNSSAATCQREQRHSWWTHENKGTPGEQYFRWLEIGWRSFDSLQQTNSIQTVGLLVIPDLSQRMSLRHIWRVTSIDYLLLIYYLINCTLIRVTKPTRPMKIWTYLLCADDAAVPPARWQRTAVKPSEINQQIDFQPVTSLVD